MRRRRRCAAYANGPCAGAAAITRRPVGTGAAWYLGTLPDEATLTALLAEIVRDAGGTGRSRIARGVEAIRRRTDDGRSWTFLINHSGARIRFSLSGFELISGSPADRLELEPAGVAVVREGSHARQPTPCANPRAGQRARRGPGGRPGHRTGVSDMTVRRDIEHLARRDLLRTRPRRAVAASDHAELSRTQPSADEPGSRQVASHAAGEGGDRPRGRDPRRAGAAIALSAGTTTVALARGCARHPGADHRHQQCASGPGARGSASAAGHTVVLTGGTRTPSEALVGPIAVQALRGLHVDLVFLGVHGLDLKAGGDSESRRGGDESGAHPVRAVAVWVADHTKWGIVGLGTIVGLDAVATLVTDAGLPADARASVADVVGRLVVTDVPAQLVTTSSGPVA